MSDINDVNLQCSVSPYLCKFSNYTKFNTFQKLSLLKISKFTYAIIIFAKCVTIGSNWTNNMFLFKHEILQVSSTYGS